MILVLFCVFLALSLVLITLGLIMPEHTELSLIGFVFLFLLSFTLMGNNLQYQDGYNESVTYGYVNISNVTMLFSENHTVTYTYQAYDDTVSKFNTHTAGYWLAVISVVGFIGVILSLRKSRRFT